MDTDCRTLIVTSLPSNSNPTAGSRTLWLALLVTALISAACIHYVEGLKETALCFPDPKSWFNSFLVVIASTEPAGLYVVLGFCVLTAFLTWRRLHFLPLPWKSFSPRKIILVLAATSSVVSVLGTWLITHHHPLACDEFMPDFQARIFLSGKLQAEIPEDLRFVSRALTPLQAMRTSDDSHWNQGYLPVYAAMRTPFLWLHLEMLVNPLFGVIAILAMAGVIRLLWPGKPWLAVAGTAMVALSPQILVNDMTVYAMPAHLALNTVWLWLYLQPGKRRFWLAPIVGVLAIGLHSPFVHALFVVPFLIRLLLDRRWKAVCIYGIIYLGGCAGCWYWWHVFAPDNAAPSTPLLVWHLQRILATVPLNLLLLLSWNTLPCIILALVGLRFFPQLPVPVRDGVISCLLTFCFYALLPFNQSYGWGNRYCYGVLGCLILLAVAGLNEWTTRAPGREPGQFVLLGLAGTVLVLIPLRFSQVERFIRPFARAESSFNQMDADLVIFDSRVAWNSGDLLRNGPFLENRPLIANQRHLTPENIEALMKQFPRTHFVNREEMAGYGLFTTPWRPPAAD
ncbi:MAG: hypothetical protein ABIT76_06990 [Chthoniobacterales bacterium]